MSNYGMNLFFATLWLVMIIAILSPTVVGEWEAKRDQAYDNIMTGFYTEEAAQ
jgi:hypothetical protein|tara:strand:- start:242 stop:400 length:159 start_codon:yes stop_codon:yes gene_type:complete